MLLACVFTRKGRSSSEHLRIVFWVVVLLLSLLLLSSFIQLGFKDFLEYLDMLSLKDIF